MREEDENADAPLDGQVGRRAADVDVAHVVAARRVAEELQLGALKQRPARGLHEIEDRLDRWIDGWIDR